MRVLVAGATGVIGRTLVPQLRARGHQVTAMVRDGHPAGEDVVVADALDREAVHAAVLAARPDVVVHQLTALRVQNPDSAETTARLRTEGTANLLTAARAAGAGRFVAQSISFATAPAGAPLLTEDAPLHLDAPEPCWARTVGAVAELERLVLGAKDLSTVVLRYGTLYGPGTLYAADGAVGAALAAGKFRVPEVADGITSFLHVEDAGLAAVLAAESTVRGVFNVTDDDPAEGSVWVPEFARQLGGPPPRRVPADLAERLLDWFTHHQLTTMRGASNGRARDVLGWQPARPSWRKGPAEGDR